MNTNHRPQDIAIIGMAGRFPKSGSVAELWENLRQGVECISFFTDADLEEAGIEFPKNNARYVKARGFLEKADHFDAEFFGYTPKEAEIMDPQQRVFLECAWEALESTGYGAGTGEKPVGVFGGASMNTYLLANVATRPELMELVGHHQLMLASDKDFLTTRVSYKLNLRGPSLNVQTACSTSLVAVCVACESLLSMACDMALAGGVSVTFPQKKGYLHQEGGIVSPDGHCRAFDAQAQGTVAGEGVGIVVLKRLSDALADRDHIYAVIRGYAVNNDGGVKAGFTAPSADGQAEVIAMAQAMADVEPRSVGYVVAHGTGTPLGDPIELAGLTTAFGTASQAYCALTSTKTNLGHLDAAAGIAGLINAALALHDGAIPPSLHFSSPNPKIDWAGSPFFVNTRLLPWPRGQAARRAGVSSFGIGGTNAHVVLEEAPVADTAQPSRPYQLLVLSARSSEALNVATANLSKVLGSKSGPELADTAFTLQTGRRAFKHRRVVVCRDGAGGVEAISRPDPKRVLIGLAAGRVPAVVFMFPGQGAQHLQMGAEIYRTEALFREVIDECAATLDPILGVDLRSVIWPETDADPASASALTPTSIAQPALFVVSYALARLWMSWGVHPQCLIGHSIGEYVAACVAGVMSLPDALMVVARRGQMMQAMPAGSMLAVRLSEKDVQEFVGEPISLAALNGPSLSVLSGPTENIGELQRKLKSRGVAAQLLAASHAFHSSMMDPVIAPLTEVIKAIPLNAPRIPFISNVTGSWITEQQACAPEYWGSHMRRTVRFASGLDQLRTESDRIFLETGPGQVLTTAARQITQGISLCVSSLRHPQSAESDWLSLLAALGQLWIAGVAVNWEGFYVGEIRRRVPLPTYPFERKRYWVEPARGRRSGESVSSTQLEGPPPKADVEQGNGSLKNQSPNDIEEVLAALLSALSGIKPETIQGAPTFLQLGLDSLFLTQACQRIEEIFGIHLRLADILQGSDSNKALAAHLLARGADPTRAAARLAGVLGQDSQKSVSPAVGEGRSKMVELPLTPGQKEVWLAAGQSDMASAAFNLCLRGELEGQLEIPVLNQAIARLVARHEALRLTFSRSGDTQRVRPAGVVELPLTDLAQMPGPAQREQLESITRQGLIAAFDLENGPLMRWQLVRLEQNRHILFVTTHHLACDGTSLAIIQRELGQLYSSGKNGTEASLPEPASLKQFVVDNANQAEPVLGSSASSFWLKQFHRPTPRLVLPGDGPNAKAPGLAAGSCRRSFPAKLLGELRQFSAEHHCTHFAALLAVYYLWLYRLTGQEAIVVGVPAGLRNPEQMERLVGHAVSFLPLRMTIDAVSGFAEHLKGVCELLYSALEHKSFTFGALAERLGQLGRLELAPVIGAAFNYMSERNELRMDGLITEVAPVPRAATHFDVTLDVTELDDILLLEATFRTDVVSATTMDRWLSHFETLLEQVLAHPKALLAEYDMGFAAERKVSPNSDAASPRVMGSAESRNEPDQSASSGTQKVLAQIWREVLRVGDVGWNDNFFELGGHSVLLTQVLSRIRKEFSVDLPLRSMFEHPTIAELAAVVEAQIIEQARQLSDEEVRGLRTSRGEELASLP